MCPKYMGLVATNRIHSHTISQFPSSISIRDRDP